MAVIIKDRLTGEAKDLTQSAIKSEISMGNTGLIQLGQQRSLVESQQQGLVAATNATLGQVQDNIYRAQRQAREESAVRGFSSDISVLREASNVQDMVSQELSNVINQSEQGAINLAGQQSAINKAEVQLAAPSILNEYSDLLISQGKASQDIGRQITSGLSGAFSGAIAGLLGAKVAQTSAKTLFDPTSKTWKKAIAGLGIGATAGLGANQIGNLVNVANKEYGNGEELYDPKVGSQVLASLGAGGGILGAALGMDDKRTGGMFKSARKSALDSSFFKKTSFRKPITGGLSTTLREPIQAMGKSKLGAAFSKVTGGASNMMKVNPYLAAGFAATGAIVGGLTAGLDKKYSIDLDTIRNDDTFSQLEGMGIDLDVLTELVYNK